MVQHIQIKNWHITLTNEGQEDHKTDLCDEDAFNQLVKFSITSGETMSPEVM